MADYAMFRKGRNAVSSFLHVFLNLLLACSSMILTVVSGRWWPGLLLVFLSKWRVFAVRPRYWRANLVANLVDYIVCISLVLLFYLAGTNDGFNFWHLALATLYAVWLIVVKPKSDPAWVEVQALCAVFFGTFAVALTTSVAPPLLSTALCFVIAYASARHVLAQTDDRNFRFSVLVFALLLAELNWIFYHWTILYRFAGSPSPSFGLPQLAIVSTLVAFLLARGHKSAFYHDGKVCLDDIFLPAIFSVAIVLIMLLLFSEPIFNV